MLAPYRSRRVGNAGRARNINRPLERKLLALRLESFPALELLHQQLLDVRAALRVGAQRSGRLLVVVGRAELRMQRFLLGFQRLDLLRQGFELAGFLVGKPDCALWLYRNEFSRRSPFL